MNKAYNRINWENYPSLQTPLNEQNLNKMDGSVDEIDNRVISLDTRKFDKAEAQGLIKNITFDLQTGILKKYYYNGSTEEINTGISKLNMNLRFDKENQILYIVNADGTEDPVDLSVFITNYEFEDSDTIAHNISSDGTVTSIVKDGSITEDKMQPNYLAEIKVEAAKAQLSESNAAEYATAAENSEKLAESYAHGGTGIREGEDTDNAKKYKELAEQAYENLQNSVVTGVKGNAETNYRQGNINITPENIGLGNVPNVSTNDQTPTFTQATTRENIASGETNSTLWGKVKKWLNDLKAVAFSGSYNDLSNRPGVVSKAASGFAPQLPNEATTTKYLRQDGTWQVPPDTNTTYGNMKGATASAAGTAGLAPAPAKGAQNSYLTGGATYQNVDDHAAAFTSSDVADGSATAWTSVAKLASGETHKSIFEKLSTMFKNVRYLYKMLGTTNISSIGDGTVTGAVNALNTGIEAIHFGIYGCSLTNGYGFGTIPLDGVRPGDFVLVQRNVGGVTIPVNLYIVSANAGEDFVRVNFNTEATSTTTADVYVLWIHVD